MSEEFGDVVRGAVVAVFAVEPGHGGDVLEERVGDAGQGVDDRYHFVREAAVVRPAGDLQTGAQEGVALAAGRAVAAPAGGPADPAPLADALAVVWSRPE
ncbi:hypothetical protein [Streptomyces sp. MUSC 1]|uniref:Uncharacterized protein n=1 Tax=Streptomyces monashensis TaxID=1678012 RepID=A0A1S2Q7X9_9ACTN|nr:hypothetical protein BIV23_25705 [Streptomyces monashensis]